MEINFEIKSKGSLRIYFGEKVAIISGELTFEPPVFYADLNSFNNWGSTFENEVIEENQKNEMVTFIINSDCSKKIIFK
jgi:hypothetical protein